MNLSVLSRVTGIFTGTTISPGGLLRQCPNHYAFHANLDENGVQQSPGWSREALEFLIHERHVKAVGHETFDTDAGIPAAEHGLVNEYYLLEQNIYQVEVLNQLDQVPAVGALISIAFPHWDKATGSPVRAVAILP